MRWTGWTLLGVGLGAVVTAVVTVSCAGRTNVESGAERTLAEKIARGKQISWAAGCNDCHTPGTFYGVPDTTRLLSGSELGWEGPWGVTYPRNLTPDPETGIASWTEHDIVTAFRTGQRPDKSPLLPPMPWPAYAHMSDDDAYALAAYIKSLPPVRHQAPARLAPGKGAGPRLVFPPPPAWDGRHLPPPEAAATTKSEDM
jgi:mono/diheme cytochrome c family protein